MNICSKSVRLDVRLYCNFYKKKHKICDELKFTGDPNCVIIKHEVAK